jgi:hypothetical protein
MLDEHRTLRRYWAEAVNTACHVGNRIFLSAFLSDGEIWTAHGVLIPVVYLFGGETGS